MAIGANLLDPETITGQHRAPTGPAKLTRHRGLPADRNNNVFGFKRDRAIFRQVLAPVLWVEPLQIKVLVIKIAGGHSPAQRVVAPD